jgi:hypothetical protein
MPAALKITLTKEENKTLQELEVADSVPRRTKKRATALRLNARGWKVSRERRLSRMGRIDSKTNNSSLESTRTSRFMGSRRQRTKTFMDKGRLASFRTMVTRTS